MNPGDIPSHHYTDGSMPRLDHVALKSSSRSIPPIAMDNEPLETKRRRTDLASPGYSSQRLSKQNRSWTNPPPDVSGRPPVRLDNMERFASQHAHHQLMRSQSLSSLRLNSQPPAVSPQIPTRNMVNLSLEDWTQHKQRLELNQPPLAMQHPYQHGTYPPPFTLPVTAPMSAADQRLDQDPMPLQTAKHPSHEGSIDHDTVNTKNPLGPPDVCIGMIKSDLVTSRPLRLIKDDLYEPVTVRSEGKRDSKNYSFTVTSCGFRRVFYGWVPFEDTRILGPLFHDRIIWWDAIIPRAKVNATRIPLYFILYCKLKDTMYVANELEKHNMALQVPPFFNPACQYANVRQHLQDRQKNNNSNSSSGSSSNSLLLQKDDQELQDRGYLQEQAKLDIAQLLESIPHDIDRDACADTDQSTTTTTVSDALGDDAHEYLDGMTVPLLPHQVLGITWMRGREDNESSRGGILADMGLGKTIQTLGLILSTQPPKDQPRQMTLIVSPLALIQQWADEIRTKSAQGLIHALVYHGPTRTRDTSVLLQYDVVITTYQVVVSESPNPEKKGRQRKDDTLSTTDTASPSPVDSDTTGEDMDVDDSKSAQKVGHGPLFQIPWYRVVLDEAQQIKNRTTRAALACTELEAQKRWCLTGTPIQNHVDELYSLLRFLRIQPLCDYPTFRKTISIPIQLGNGSLAFERLKGVLMAIMLRRTKAIIGHENVGPPTPERQSSQENESSSTSPGGGDRSGTSSASQSPLVSRLSLRLPAREKTDIVLYFSEQERALYTLLSQKTRTAVENIFQSGKGDSNYLNMLCMILRLRQACDHPQLVLRSVGSDKDALDLAASSTSMSMTPPRRESSEATMKRLLMEQMAHSFGWRGKGGESAHDQGRSCDLCGRPVRYHKDDPNDMTATFCDTCDHQVHKFTGPMVNTGRLPHSEQFFTSTKINKILEILATTERENPGEKTIIFSQFTCMLDLLEDPLQKSGFKYCRYDGSMTSAAREKSLQTLKSDNECMVMLISLKCGSLGLNLTAANRVILTDIWWNPAVEDQAIDRVHRIGQTRPVQVTRLLIDQTIEQKIIQLQQKKAKLVRGALGHGTIKNARLTRQEIRALFDL